MTSQVKDFHISNHLELADKNVSDLHTIKPRVWDKVCLTNIGHLPPSPPPRKQNSGEERED